jgi:metallophosphoesterase (TIGR03767 family)
MRDISRRDFIRFGAGAAAAAGPLSRLATAEAVLGPGRLEPLRGLTTLEHTMVRGPVLREGSLAPYYRLKDGPGEPHRTRTELAGRKGTGRRRPLLSFVQYTDSHLADTQSPLRVEWLDRYNDGPCMDGLQALFVSAYRANEPFTTHFLESMNRRIRRVRVGPVTGRRLEFAMATGDNVDNEQFNELRWFIDLMDGGRTIDPNSGGPDYEGVMSRSLGDTEYWHPDPVDDKYKQQFGFPDYPGVLQESLKPYRSTGVGLPWMQTFGNHDGLIQGNFPKTMTMNTIAIGPLKVVGAPDGFNPCDGFARLLDTPTALTAGPAIPVVADPDRRVVSRPEYIAEHFKTAGTPVGHGFTKANMADGTAYYFKDTGVFRLIALDTVNPGGESSGSVGDQQLQWFEARLAEVHSHHLDANGAAVHTRNRDKLVIIFSHHGLRSLDSRFDNPNPFDTNLGNSDLPRHKADDVEALVHRFPNVIAWVNGHTHRNEIVPRPNPNPKTAGTPGFWDINTAAHIDWNCQSRILEVVLNADRTISIFSTMVNDDSPADPRGATGIARIASIARELTANDYQKGIASGSGGEPKDRNVELVVPAPAWLR